MTTDTQVALLVVCELAQVTQDGKLSLLGIFSRLAAKKIPIRIPRFYVVSILTGTPLSEHQVSFQILSPTVQDVIQEFRANVTLGFDGKANVMNELTNVNLLDYGTYTAMINIDGQRRGATEFAVAEPEGPNLKRSASTIAN